MKPPVILQVLPRLRTGGVERGTIEIAAAIKNAGWQPLVASEGGAMIPHLLHRGGEHITLPLASKNPLRIWRNAKALENIIRARKVDIIHARSRAPAWSAYIAAKRTGIPFVTTFHGMYGLKPALKKKYNEVMVKGDRVIAVSRFVAEHIAQNYTVEAFRMRVIHRGVDLGQFDPRNIVPQRMIELATQWRIPDDVPLIMVPGRITRWKGQHIAVQALAKLPHRNFFCLLVGDDTGHAHYRKEVEQLIIASGLESYVRFAGNTAYMAEAYMLADMIVAPSIEPEAFGRVPVEAQAMGKLVIATNHGGACETIIDGQTGWLTIPGDTVDLARVMDYALQLSPEDKEQIGRHARQHVQDCFSADIMCSKTLETYRELIGHIL